MLKSKSRWIMAFFMFAVCGLLAFSSENMELEKVLIFSRHGLRSPLTASGSIVKLIQNRPKNMV